MSTSDDRNNFQSQITIGEDSDSPTNTTTSSRCCFNFPCFNSGQFKEDRWWARPVRAFKKIREWSEIVAGPKWKTFIRRFNRNNRNRVSGKFQYDPLSYALNFDEGPAGQNGQFDEECDDQFPDFSSRYAAIPLSAKSSMDFGKGSPAG